MAYGKYFIKGQKVFLKRIFDEEEQVALDTLTGYAMRTRPMQLELALPYGSDAAESYPFIEGMKFEIMTDHKGMGLRLQASFLERTSGTDINLQFEGNLEFISRRIFPRVDVNAWVGLQRGGGNLAEMRTLWKESMDKIKSGVSAAELTDFNKYLLNLAGGGMRLPFRAPVELAELVLLFLSIGDKKGIICALSEVVWVGKPQDNGQQQAGLRFLNILEEDQERINTVVKVLLDKLGKTGMEGSD